MRPPWITRDYIKQLKVAKQTLQDTIRFSAMFDQTKEIEYLDTAISLARSIVDDNAGDLLSPILSLLRQGYDQTKDPKYLDQAIELGQLGMAIGPSCLTERAEWLHRLGVELYMRFSLCGGREDIDQAIEITDEAVLITPAGDQSMEIRASHLMKYLFIRHLRFGAIEDLDRCIGRGIESVLEVLEGSKRHVDLLLTLGVYLTSKYKITADLSHLQEGISYLEAVDAMKDAESRSDLLHTMAIALLLRSKHLSSITDLDRCIEACTESLAMRPLGDIDRPVVLQTLSNSLINRYDISKKPEDIDRAIELAEEAVLLIDPNDPKRADMSLSLASCIKRRYHELPVLEDLSQNIQRMIDGIALIPLDHPMRPEKLANFAGSLLVRYERLGRPEDLEEVIRLSQDALGSINMCDGVRARVLLCLSHALQTRFHRLLPPIDIDQTLKQAEKLVEEAKDIDESVEYARQAVAMCPHSADRVDALDILASSLATRHRAFNKDQDLNESILLRRQVLEALPVYHSSRAVRLCQLGRALVFRAVRTPGDDGTTLAIKIFLEAWESVESTLANRFEGVFPAAYHLAAMGKLQESNALLEMAIKMLPKISPRYLGRGDLECVLSKVGNIAPIFASISLMLGAEPSYTLALLEYCRGIIMSLVMDYRSEVSELHIKSPELFERFSRFRTEVDSPPFKAATKGTMDEWSCYQNYRRQQKKASDDLEQTLADMRQLPGLEGFLLPPAANDLMAMATEGPIVMLNCTGLGSDAFIVKSSGIKVIKLPGLNLIEVKEKMRSIKGLVTGKRSTYATRNQTMAKFLFWLWEVAVSPVLDDLQLRIVNNELPRMWWIGIGILANAPFHAAGNHSPGSTQNTISRVISSYIPTMRALSFARQKQLKLPSSNDYHLLLVFMPTTPTKGALHHAAEEVANIVGAVNGKTNTTILQSPGADMVLEKLQSSHAIHFACHGISETKIPSNSRLLLRKVNKLGEEELDYLTVQAIASIHIKDAQIAYLSACSTADNASVKLPDESIHIASAFQLAGFSHVLATMWASNDAACKNVSKGFYKRLFSEGRSGDKEGHSRVSSAFHYAVKSLRDDKKNWAQPLLWASFMHTGA